MLVRFNPFGAEAKTARLMLAAIPPHQRTLGTKIQSEILNNSITKKPLVKITFKDKTDMEFDPSNTSFEEASNLLDRHSRKLRIKETIENQ